MVLLKKILHDFPCSDIKIPEIINVTSGNSKTLFEYSKIVSENYCYLFGKTMSKLVFIFVNISIEKKYK